MIALQIKRGEQALQSARDIEKLGDPFMSLGIGLNLYRNTLHTLAIAFACMSLFMYPVIKEYHNGSAINLEVTSTKWGTYSIANIGYSTV